MLLRSEIPIPPEYTPLPQQPSAKKRTKSYIVVALVAIVIVSILFIVIIFLSSFIPRVDTRGLRITQVWRTNDGWFPIVENQGSETLYITRFYNEKGATIETSVYDRNQFWNDNGYFELPSGKFLTLVLTGANYYSNEIFVEFTDGYRVKIYG